MSEERCDIGVVPGHGVVFLTVPAAAEGRRARAFEMTPADALRTAQCLIDAAKIALAAEGAEMAAVVGCGYRLGFEGPAARREPGVARPRAQAHDGEDCAA